MLFQYTDGLFVLLAILLTLVLRTLPSLRRQNEKKLSLSVVPAASISTEEVLTPRLDSLHTSPVKDQPKVDLTLPRRATKTIHVKIAAAALTLLQPEKNLLLPETSQISLACSTLGPQRLPGHDFIVYLLTKALHPACTRAAMMQYVDAARSYLEFLLGTTNDRLETSTDLARVFARRMFRVKEILDRPYASIELKRRELKIVRRDPRFRAIFELPGLRDQWKLAESKTHDDSLPDATRVLGSLVKTVKMAVKSDHRRCRSMDDEHMQLWKEIRVM